MTVRPVAGSGGSSSRVASHPRWRSTPRNGGAPADVPDDLHPRGVGSRVDRHRAALPPSSKHRRQRGVFVERLPAAPVHVAHGRADLRVRIGREILHQEIHEPAVTLQDREDLRARGPVGSRPAAARAGATRAGAAGAAPRTRPGCRRRCVRGRSGRKRPERRTSSVFRGRASWRLYLCRGLRGWDWGLGSRWLLRGNGGKSRDGWLPLSATDSRAPDAPQPRPCQELHDSIEHPALCRAQSGRF